MDTPPEPDLDLGTGWYAQIPPQFPPEALQRTVGKIAGWSMSTSHGNFGGRDYRTITVAMRCNGLSTLKIKVTWDLSDPIRSGTGEHKWIPEPEPPSNRELEVYKQRYGDAVARWAESRRGTKVGNGECWTLSNDALRAVAEDCEAQGIEPCMASQSLIHGALVFSFLPPAPPSPPGGVAHSLVARGDTIQFLNCEFHYPGGGKGYCGLPDHTAVVTGVRPDGVLEALHQNTGGKKIVMDTTFDFSKLVKGEVRIFRPVGVSWAGTLDAGTW